MTEANDNCETCNQRGSCPIGNSAEALTCEADPGRRIKHKIIVASGKGGVGKSTVSVNLARALLLDGFKVGILDADITGPNIPKLLGIEDQSLVLGEDGIKPADSGGIKAASMALLLSSPDSPVVWRGPMKMAAIKQFIQDVDWGELDFLIIDLPPGTSDEPLSVAQLIPDLSGAIIVTTPQEVSLLDSRKAVNMIRSMKLSVIGIIENMAGLVCPHCYQQINIFQSGGGERMAEEMNVRFLGSIPIDPQVCSLGDAGQTFVEGDTQASDAFRLIVERLKNILR